MTGGAPAFFAAFAAVGPANVFVGATQLAGPMPGKLVCMDAVSHKCIEIILHIPLLSKA